MNDHRIPPAALWLGLGGLIPFVACGAAVAVDLALPVIGDPMRALVGYGAVILSFLGGARWGFALRMQDAGLQARAFLLAVCPSIAGWLLLLAPPPLALAASPILFLLLGVADRRLTEIGAPLWYARLRTLLTSIVVLTLFGALLRAWL
jgi:hypothetical protein